MAKKPGKSTKSTSGKSGRGKERDPDIKVTQENAPKKKSVGPVQFWNQVISEGKKVTWTSRNETFASTIMVLIMVVIMSLFFLLVDQLLRIVVQFILGL